MFVYSLPVLLVSSGSNSPRLYCLVHQLDCFFFCKWVSTDSPRFSLHHPTLLGTRLQQIKSLLLLCNDRLSLSRNSGHFFSRKTQPACSTQYCIVSAKFIQNRYEWEWCLFFKPSVQSILIWNMMMMTLRPTFSNMGIHKEDWVVA